MYAGATKISMVATRTTAHAALHNLEKHKFGDESTARSSFRSWDLEKVITDRKIFSVKEGELLSTYDSHCAHYSALAFRAWGLDVASPYEIFDGIPASEGKMALLDVAAEIGPLGTEPLLLEANDFGLSPEVRVSCRGIVAAQLREYRTTGRLVCVSEGPIDRAPWFTYQGLQFDAPDRTWVIDTVRKDERFKADAFQDENRVISPKAAFLWAESRYPHSFSNMLVNYIRGTAKTTIESLQASILTPESQPLITRT